MSLDKHHCIIIIGDEEILQQVRKIAVSYFPEDMVSPIIPSPVNCRRSLYIAPDGSGEGWERSNRFNTIRENFYLSLYGLLPYLSDVVEVELPEDGKYSVRNIRTE